MKGKHLLWLFGAILILASAMSFGCDADKLAEPNLDFCDSLQFNTLTYDGDIKSIIDEKCTNGFCHQGNNGNFTNYQGMLLFLDNESFNRSIFIERDMPPEPTFLTTEESDKIKCWLNAGYPKN